ncbi:flagellar biosynthesis anti-sigma factor FlgM [Alteraurantiacibacter palmitatis]|uniref:Flagellar biosynthesis anti-sigma factor FlgM n=1 Tax=Alteraurantiacibacter palmitatis TaxID=2054628 RepID=A0ABV7EAQ7_9SPHN
MALYDINRLNGPGAVRSVARDLAGEKPEAKPAIAASPAPVDKGVAVETAGRVTAGSAPVDKDRVAEIRAALRDGNYPLVPTRISDAIIAARLMLSTN